MDKVVERQGGRLKSGFMCSLATEVWVLCLLGVMCCGCNRSQRWDLEGQVTFGGQSVQEGHITFDPVQPGKGGGFARIVQGKFDTRREGRNHSGGPHRITIAAYKGLKNPKNPDSDVLLAFPAYETEVELPTKSAAIDFDVPSDWPQRAASGAEGR